MFVLFWEMEIFGWVVDVVDGWMFNSSVIRSFGVDLFLGYQDFYLGCILIKGEVGCFFSYYFIWEEVVVRGLFQVLVFEDDVCFESNFRGRLEWLMENVEVEKLLWDLIYFGWKQVNFEKEVVVEGLLGLVVVGYFYWILVYVLSLVGVCKLLVLQFLCCMLFVDEFLFIMFDQYFNEQYKVYFWLRDLVVFFVQFLFVVFIYYVGDVEWFSDMEIFFLWDDDSGCFISWSGF